MTQTFIQLSHYPQMMKRIPRAAAYHLVPLHKDPVEDDFLFEILSSTTTACQYLPMLKGMLRHSDIIKDQVRTRIITPCVNKKITKLYPQIHLALKANFPQTPWWYLMPAKEQTVRHQQMPLHLTKSPN